MLGSMRHSPRPTYQLTNDSPSSTLGCLFKEGTKFLKEDEHEQALSMFTAGLGLNQKIPGLHLACAVALGQLGRISEAVSHARIELAAFPDNEAVRHLLIQLGGAIEGILLDDSKILLDPRSPDVGGSWQGAPKNGVPSAWDMLTLEFFYERTLEFEQPTVLDVGANTGSFCLLAKINSSIDCFAFEPVPILYELLNNNILLNNLQANIVTLPIALSNETGTAIIKYPKSGIDSGFACIGNPQRFEDWLEIMVPLFSIDEIAHQVGINKVDIIKTDTEGCELFVLKGAENTIKQYHPDILSEYCPENTKQFGYEPDKIFELLSSWGYKHERVSIDDIYFHHPRKDHEIGRDLGKMTSKAKINLDYKTSRTSLACPHCKRYLYVKCKGLWCCPYCSNEFVVGDT